MFGGEPVCLRVLLDQKCTVMFTHRENSELPHKERQCHSVFSWFLSISDLTHLITNSGNIHELKQTFKGKMSEIRTKMMTDIEQNHPCHWCEVPGVYQEVSLSHCHFVETVLLLIFCTFRKKNEDFAQVSSVADILE